MMDFGVNRLQERLVATPGAHVGPDGAVSHQGVRGVRAPYPVEVREPLAEPGAVSAEGESPDAEKTFGIVQEANKDLASLGRDVRLDIRQTDGGQMVVQVIDPRSDRVIREVPPKELLELRERLKETLGVIFDRAV